MGLATARWAEVQVCVIAIDSPGAKDILSGQWGKNR